MWRYLPLNVNFISFRETKIDESSKLDIRCFKIPVQIGSERFILLYNMWFEDKNDCIYNEINILEDA